MSLVKRKLEDDDDGSDAFNQVSIYANGPDYRSENENGDSNDDSDHDDQPKYREAMEPFPSAPAYDPDFPDVKARAVNLGKAAANICDHNSSQSEEGIQLRNSAKEVQSIPETDRKTIGLVGDAGQGKSSLLNALTDISGLAKAVAIGSSVTFVPMVYERATDAQPSRFSARVKFFDLPAIAQMLQEAISDWQTYHSGTDNQWSEEEEKDRHDKASTTEVMFQSAFCASDGFSSSDETKETLRDLCSIENTIAEKAERFVGIVKTALDKKFPNNVYAAYADFGHQNDLRDWLDPQLAETEDSSQAALWPFVEKVVIGVRGSRVLDRWTFVDLPGLTDVHQVRVRATLHHIKQCDHLFAIAPLGRVITHPSVRNVVRDYGVAFRGNISVVVTKCDDGIQDCTSEIIKELVKTYPALREEEQTYKEMSKQTQNEIKDLRKEIKDLRKGMKTPKRRRTSTGGSSTDNLEQKVEELEAKETELEDLDRKWFAKIYHLRTAPITEKIQEQVQQYLPEGATLKVFFASNTHYETLKYPPFEGPRFQLSADETGIPKIRSHLLTLAAADSFLGLQNFIDNKLAAFIHGCRLWTENKLNQSRSELISIVKKPREAASVSIQRCSRDSRTVATKMMIQPFQARQAEFAADAVKVVRENLQTRHYMTIKSFISYHGKHTTRAMQDSWNKLFTTSMRQFLNAGWEHFRAKVLEGVDRLLNDTLNNADEIMRLLKLEKDKAASGLPIPIFGRALDARKAGLTESFSTAMNALKADLRNTLLMATNDDDPDNYFVVAMRTIYDQYKDEKGDGYKDRVLTMLRCFLAAGGTASPFAQVAAALEQNIYEALQRHLETCNRCVDKAFDDITDDIKFMVQEQKSSVSDTPLREALNTFLSGAKVDLGALKQKMIEIKSRYPAEAQGI